MKRALKALLIVLAIGVYGIPLKAQLVVDTNGTIEHLVQDVLVGTGVSVSNVQFTGAKVSIGEFSNGQSTNLGIDEGLMISTGSVFSAIGPNTVPNQATNTHGGSDPQLAAISGGFPILDATVLEFDFVPTSDTLKFKYIFGSEEYPEWVGTMYNDVFGFFISGPNPSGGSYSHQNLAVVPGTNQPVSISTINNGSTNTGPCTNCSYYIDNTSGTTIEFDGFTTVLTAWVLVNPCQTYHLKIAIGDAADHSYDSGVFLEKNSLASQSVDVDVSYSHAVGNDLFENCNDARVSFTLPYPSPSDRTVHYSVSGTANEGVDYNLIPDSMVIPAGSDSVSFLIQALSDNVPEGSESIILDVQTNTCSNEIAQIQIQDYQALSLNLGQDTTVCKNQPLPLIPQLSGGKTPYIYTWNNGSSTLAQNYTPGVASSYILSVEDACLHSAADTLHVDVWNLPAVSITSQDDTLCPGERTWLKAHGTSQYQWFNHSGIQQNLSDSVQVQPSISPDTYTVVGTDGNGCKDTAAYSVHLFPQAVLSVQKSSAYICEGDSMLLSASGLHTYEWIPGGFLSDSTLHQVYAFPSSTQSYKVRGADQNGCTDSMDVQVEVKALPNLLMSSQQVDYCLGGQASASVSGANTYQWTPAYGLNSSTSSSIIISSDADTTYYVEATDAYGCVQKDSVKVDVHPYPAIQANTNDTLICDSTSISLQLTGALNYTWSPSTYLNTASGSTVVSSPASSITYTAIGSNAYGCSDTTEIRVAVGPHPSVQVINPQVCVGDSSYLKVQSTIPGTQYVWNTGSINDSIAVQASATSVYTVTATAPNGCSSSIQSQITVINPPGLSISPSNPGVCPGGSVTVQVSGASTYQWLPAPGLSVSSGAQVVLNPTSQTSYTVIGTDVNGCKDTLVFDVVMFSTAHVQIDQQDTTICPGDSILLSASGAQNYTWSSFGNSSFSAAGAFYASPQLANLYIVTGSDTNGCIDQDTIMVDVSPVPSIIPTSNNICNGDSVMLFASSNKPNTTFQWSTGDVGTIVTIHPVGDTLITLLATDPHGCSAVDSFMLMVNQIPVVAISADDSVLCSGNTTQLMASGAGSYQWYQGSNMISANSAVLQVGPNHGTHYTVIGFDALGCSDTADFYLDVVQGVQVDLVADRDEICAGESISMKASGATQYSWSPVSSIVPVTNDSVLAYPQVPTDYKVIGSIANGCKDSAVVNIKVHAIPQLTINADTQHLCPNEVATLSVNGAQSYLWSSNISGTGNQVQVNPAANSFYTVVGFSAHGCKDTARFWVERHTNPNIIVSQDSVHLCYGDSVMLTASGAAQYNWSPAVAASNPAADTVWIKPLLNTDYTLVGRSLYACSDTVLVHVNVSQKSTIGVGTDTLCEGDTTQLFAQNISPGSSYAWSTGATTPSIQVHPSLFTSYKLTVTDASSCITVDSAVVWVHTLPQVQFSTSDSIYVCYGDSIFVQLGGGSLYQWNPMIGVHPITASSAYIHAGSSMGYTVNVTDSNGCENQVPFYMGLYPTTQVTLSASEDTLCHGGSSLLTAQGAQSYQWSPSNSLTSISQDSVVGQPLQSTLYTVIGTDSNQCRDTASTHITLLGSPSISPAHPGVCPGDSVQLVADGGLGAQSYSWSTGHTTPSVWLSPSASAYVYLSVSYANGCTVMDSVWVDAYQGLDVQASISQAFSCSDDSVTLKVNKGVQFQWYPAAGLSSTSDSVVLAYPPQTTTYHVHATDANGCAGSDSVTVHIYAPASVSIAASATTICKHDSISLFASGSANYQWLGSGYLGSATHDTNYVMPGDTTSYSVIGIDHNGCRDTAEIQIDVRPDPQLQIVKSSSVVCQGDTLNLLVTGAQTYEWTAHPWIDSLYSDHPLIYPLANTQYMVVGTDSFGCNTLDSIYVDVNRNPFIYLDLAGDSICYGDTVMIRATGAANYTWNLPVISQSLHADTVWVAPQQSIDYTVTGVSTDGCYSSVDRHVEVLPVPDLQLSLINDTLCQGDTAYMEIHGGLSYLWTGNGIYPGLTDSLVYVAPSVSTSYPIQALNIYGCATDTQAYIHVHQLPNVVANADTAVCYGDTSLLYVQGATQYQWSGAGLINPVGSQTQAFHLSNQRFTVVGTDQHGCKNHDTVDVVVHDQLLLNFSLSDDTLCNTDSTFAQLNPILNYQWSGSAAVTGNTSNALHLSPGIPTSYQVIGSNAFGCSDTLDFDVHVHALPNVQLTTTDPDLCAGDTTLVQVTGAQTYSWLQDGNNFGTASSYTLIPQQTHTYTVTGTDSNACKQSDTLTIYLWNLPTIGFDYIDTNLCAGDTNLLTLNGAYSYVWLNAPLSSSALGDSAWISPIGVQGYTVVGTDQHQCKDTTKIEVVVNDKPQIGLLPSDSIICEGSPFSIQATSSMNPSIFIWDQTDTLVTYLDQPYQSQWYTAKAINQYGCYDVDSFYLTVNPYPVISQFQADTTLCIHDSLTLSGQTGMPNLNYAWSTGQSSSSIVVSPLNLSTYTLIVKDSIGCSDTAQVQINVQDLPLVSITSNGILFCEGDNLNLGINMSPNCNAYQWSNGVSMPSQQITLTPADTVHIVEVCDSLGCVNRDTLTIQVNPTPIPTILASANPICIYDSLNLSGSSSVNPVSWLWSTGNTTTTDTIAPQQSTYVSLQVSDSLGCHSIDSILIQVNPLPVLSYTPNPAKLCEGDTLTLGVQGNIPLISYQWNTGSTNATIAVHPMVATTYTVTATDQNTCVNTIDIPLTTHPNPVVEIQSSVNEICEGDSLMLHAHGSTAFGSALWSSGGVMQDEWVNPALTTIFNVIYTDTNGCMGEDTVLIHVKQRPTVDLMAIDTICSEDSTVVQYLGNANATATASWDFDGATVLSGSGLNPHWLEWNAPGLYTVHLEVTQNGCTSVPDSIDIQVFETPLIDFVSTDPFACTGSPTGFVPTPDGMQSYHWDFGISTTLSDTSDQKLSQYIYTQPGLYDVTLSVVSVDGCRALLEKPSFIQVFESPQADFSVTHNHVNLSDGKVNFYNQSSNADFYLWDFDDPMSGSLNNSTLLDPFHVFTDTGAFEVILYVENLEGCTDSTTQIITVDNYSSLFIPTAFTPNGDGRNDRYYIKGKEVDWDRFEMKIYNRWGQVVYYSKDVHEGWNGKMPKTNELCPAAVYSVHVIAYDNFGKRLEQIEFLTLVR